MYTRILGSIATWPPFLQPQVSTRAWCDSIKTISSPLDRSNVADGRIFLSCIGSMAHERRNKDAVTRVGWFARVRGHHLRTAGSPDASILMRSTYPSRTSAVKAKPSALHKYCTSHLVRSVFLWPLKSCDQCSLLNTQAAKTKVDAHSQATVGTTVWASFCKHNHANGLYRPVPCFVPFPCGSARTSNPPWAARLLTCTFAMQTLPTLCRSIGLKSAQCDALSM